jgi:chromosome partitioning protein
MNVTIREVLSGDADIKKAILRGRTDIIPASAHVAVTDDMFGNKRKERRLKKLLSDLENDYDVVVLDTPPALGLMSVNALVAADVLIIPGQADPFTLKGIEEIFKTAQIVKEGPNPDLVIGGVVITRHNPRINIGRQALEAIGEIAEANGTKVFGTCIRECTALKEAQAMEQSIFEYSPRSNAAKDYRKVFDEMMEGLNNDSE